MNFAQKIRDVVAEGCVLLRNENETLPFDDSDTISIFGRCQIDYYRSGTGSGGSVHVPYTTNLLEGLLRKKPSGHNPLINKELAHVYTKWIKEHPFDNGGGGWAAEPWSQEEMPVTAALAADAAAVSTKAVVVIGRTAGEEQDNRVEEGSYLLSQTEHDMLKAVCDSFKKVVVVLNVSNIIDMTWMNNPEFSEHITAVIYMWQGGMEGGNAAGEILCGVTVPSGKLTDTIAMDIADYPSTANFGDTEKNFYKEDIYVGYRYFETFAPDKIVFPFGFGISYTTFSCNVLKAYDKNGTITTVVQVKNTGTKYAGKETVQIYYQAPQGKLGKPYRVLGAFAKTNLLAPGASQKLVLSFALTQMASYDDSGVTGNQNCFVVENGDYYFYVGTDSHSAKQIKIDKKDSITILNTMSVEKLEQAAAPTEAFERIKPKVLGKKGTDPAKIEYEKVPLSKVDVEKRIKDNLPKEIPFTGDTGIRFKNIKKCWQLESSRKCAKLDAFVAQLKPEELATLVRGEGMCSDKVCPGIASAFGGVSEALYTYGVPVAGCSDGPSGIRMDNGEEASLMPIGTLLACTWNPSLVTELYEFEAKELLSRKIDVLLGPGMNIHRHPLNGRNFEYFSEDPLVTGEMACAVLLGLKKSGIYGTIKHFATNNQETNRHVVNAIVSERALREIYLRGFEIAVKKGHAMSLMTTYSPLNGHWTGSNYDLVNTILHKEWHYTGIVMTDWWAELNDCVEGGLDRAVTKTASMVRARNDLYMVVDNNGAASNVYNDDIPASLANNKLTVGELQICAKDILRFLMQAAVANRPLRPLEQVTQCEARHTESPSGRTSAKTGEKISPSNDGKDTVWLEIENNGTYNVFATYVKVTKQVVSQSVCNILFDGRPAVSFDSRGTGGNILTVNVGRVKLQKGYYEIAINNIKPGIDVRNIYFQKTGD